jgi:hypothetical protein
LADQDNPAEEIARMTVILAMSRVILEIGCGSCEAAREIASKNPDWGVIATDKFELTEPLEGGSCYRQTAEDWKERRLPVQGGAINNLVVLRADTEILFYIPDQRVDSILLVNPEPAVGGILMDLLCGRGLIRKIKPGDRQIVAVPYSRELGVSACGGYEFDHGEDWSRGLGYIKSSGFSFRKAERVQWGVDLVKISPYSRNSTQADVYIFGNSYRPQPGPVPRMPGRRTYGSNSR